MIYMKFVKTGLIILICFMLFLMVKLLLIFPWSPDQLILGENPIEADLIVVLGGDINSRFEHAFNLAESGYSNNIFCPTIRFSENYPLISNLQDNNPDINFVTDSGSESTFDDAIITKNYIKDNKIKKILLVTSDYHSFRAKWIFNKVLDLVEIISVPALTNYSLNFLTNTIENKHWAYRSEQKKFLFYYMVYYFL